MFLRIYMHLLIARENKFGVLFLLTFEKNVNIFSKSENFGKCKFGLLVCFLWGIQWFIWRWWHLQNWRELELVEKCQRKNQYANTVIWNVIFILQCAGTLNRCMKKQIDLAVQIAIMHVRRDPQWIDMKKVVKLVQKSVAWIFPIRYVKTCFTDRTFPCMTVSHNFRLQKEASDYKKYKCDHGIILA